MAKRYEFPNAAWELIAGLVSPDQKMGWPRSNDRLMLNGIFWILCHGTAWRDLPERFGPWSTVYQRFRDWRDDGTFEQLLERLHIRLNQKGLINLGTWMINSTAVRATRASSGAGKREPEEPVDHTLGRSRGGLTTKIHMVCDANGVPYVFCCRWVRPPTSRMVKHSWIIFASPANKVGLASAAPDCSRTKATMPSICACTVIATGRSL